MYYIRKRLLGAESRYSMIKILSYFLLITWRKLRPYFQDYTIKVLTNQPLRQVSQNPESLGRLLKWAMELSQFNIHYQPQVSIKGQALINFIVECLGIDDLPKDPIPKLPTWKVYVDQASNEKGVEVRIIQISPQGH